MLKMSNVVVTAIILGTLVIAVHITFMILGHHGVAQHLSLQPAHLKQGLAVVEEGLSTLDVSLPKLLGKDGTALGHVINSLGNIEVLLHALQQLLGILHAAHVD